jgi:methylenetetrahydrofolate reductase (NADPH)
VRVDERLAAGEPVVSFELMPPRSVEAELGLWSTIEALAEFEPAFVAVTCRAGTRDLTLAIVRRLARERGVEAVPHVTATGFRRAEAIALLRSARTGGAENVLALRGDERGSSLTPLELTALAAEAGFCVLAAGYPEPHPDSRGWAADVEYVRAKADAGARVLVTQMFFDNAVYHRYVERLRAARLELPVLPGVIPITRIAQIERLVALSGATIPRPLRRELEARQDDPRAVADLGVAYATAQCAALLEAGAPGVHLYTFNRSPSARAIVSALRAHGALAGEPSRQPASPAPSGFA